MASPFRPTSQKRHSAGESLFARNLSVESLEARRLMTIPGTTLGTWDSYATYSAELQTIHNAYPALTELVSIGKTVQNRDLWAMRITDNPTQEEDEPEFFWNGPLHGDEVVGMEMTFYFMQHLLENYGGASAEGQRATRLVDNMDIWVLPSMNWDGYARTGGARRENANGVDLNRNFPEWTTRSFSPDTRLFGPYGNMFDGPTPNTTGLQKETVALMDFRRSRNFVASANLHGGDVVANYPWDTNGNTLDDYATPPDDALWREMALTYSRQNPTMFANNSFPFVNGTTNGDNWYPISGGSQDWSLLYTGCFELTLELSFTKFPAASTLQNYWSQNRESMLQYVESANWGVRGVVTRSTDGAPVAAKVTMVAPAPSPTPDANHPSTLPVYSDGDVGDFHRMLLPGTYTLRFEAPGYQTQTISNVVVAAKTNDPQATTRLDVQLVPLDTTPPALSGSGFAFETAPVAMNFSFTEDVGPTLSVQDLVLHDLTSGRVYDASELSLSYNATAFSASFRVPGEPNGVLPDSNYTAAIRRRGIADVWGNQPAQDLTLSFFVFSADADRDRDVDIGDFSVLASRFNIPGTFSNGDFNYNGTTEIGDFALLASKFNTQLPAARTNPFLSMKTGLPAPSALAGPIGDDRAVWQSTFDEVAAI
jgi:hypothetical protein